MNRRFGQPSLPRGMLRELFELQTGEPCYSPDNGGQWEPGEAQKVPFMGCVLPVSEEDWRKAPQGTYTEKSRKLYTNGHELHSGGVVCDPQEGQSYTVTGSLDYGSFSFLRRYIIEREGAAGP